MMEGMPAGCNPRTMEATLTEALLGGLPIASPDDGAARRARANRCRCNRPSPSGPSQPG